MPFRRKSYRSPYDGPRNKLGAIMYPATTDLAMSLKKRKKARAARKQRRKTLQQMRRAT